jgi:hypothetical protein
VRCDVSATNEYLRCCYSSKFWLLSVAVVDVSEVYMTALQANISLAPCGKGLQSTRTKGLGRRLFYSESMIECMGCTPHMYCIYFTHRFGFARV